MMKTAIASAVAGGTAAGASTGPAAPIMIPLFIAGAIGAVLAAVATAAIPSFDDLKVGEGAVVKGSPQNKALMQAEGGEMLIRKETLNQPTIAPNFGTQTAMENSFGLSGMKEELGKVVTAVSNLSLKTTVQNNNLAIAMDNATNPLGGSSLT